MRLSKFAVRLGEAATGGEQLMNKVLITRFLGGALLLFGWLAWMYGGARAGFYRTYYEIVTNDPILGIESRERVEKFLPGIEPLAIGFLAFVFLMLLSLVWERKQSQI